MSRADKTLQIKRGLIDAVEKCLGNISEACKKVGVTRQTYYEYYNNDPEFKESCDACGELAIDVVESQMHKQIKKGNASLIQFFMKTKARKRGYTEKVEGEVETQVNVTIKYEDAPEKDK